MKLKNITFMLLVTLVLGVLFTGCSSDDTPDTSIGAGEDSNEIQINEVPIDDTQDNTGDNTPEDATADIMPESDAEDDVEIGSLI